MTGTVLSFENLSAGYRRRTVLHGVSGVLPPGRVTALIGPNGSGKSTLFRALAGFLPYSGSITLDGRELSAWSRPQIGRRIGIVAQGADARAAFCVYDVLAMGRLPYQSLMAPLSAQDDGAILAAADRLELGNFLYRSITELSGGERQRVFLALLLVQNAPVALLDEPTSAMDPAQSVRAFSLMRALAAEGKTVAVVAHDINAALSGADCFLALKDGHIIARGECAALDSAVLSEIYQTSFTAYFSKAGERAWHPCVSN